MVEVRKMGKTEKTVYTCDRCGKTICETPYLFNGISYLGFLRWWVPVMHDYKNTYLCSTCWKGLEKYMGGADE